METEFGKSLRCRFRVRNLFASFSRLSRAVHDDGASMSPWRHKIYSESPQTYNGFSILFIFVLSALLMLRQFYSSSYFTVVISDAFIYPSWAWQFKEALKEGIIYPRWMPLNFWGYGSPTFLLYPPLAYYLVALIDTFTDSIITAMNVVKFASLFLSGTGIYYLVKEFYPARVALLSAAFYIILPYNIALMYIFGSFAAIFSCLWFSPILFLIYRHFKSNDTRYLILSGICYGALILSHLVIAYMFTYVIAAFVLYLAVDMKEFKKVAILPVILLTGFSLSAAYILPVILERKYVHLDVFTSGTYGYIYSNMFILPDMTSKFTDQGSFWPVYYNTLVLHSAIFCLLIMLFLFTSIIYKKHVNHENTQAINTFFLSIAVCSVLLMFDITSFLWGIIPFFKYILFPTRWLDVVAFSVSFLSATLFAVIYSSSEGKFAPMFMLLLLLSFVAWDFHYISGAPTYDKKEPIAVNTVIEHLPKGVLLAKIEKNNTGKEGDITIQGRGSAHVIIRKSSERVIDVKAEEPIVVRFRIFNFPGWTASMDGVPVEMAAEKDTMAIMVNVPQGNHRLELAFADTPVRRYAKIVSLVSFILLSLFLLMPHLLRFPLRLSGD